MSEQSKTNLAASQASGFADNTSGAITPLVIRTFLGDVLDSYIANQKTTGAGSNYTLTGTSALVDFGTTDPTVVLPGAGTFLLLATVQIVADASGSGDQVEVKLRNTTDNTDVGIKRVVTMPANSAQVPMDLMEIVTVASAKTVQL